jgi:3-hydroxyethyl bacteriochlorophyllide a dehydrogenase
MPTAKPQNVRAIVFVSPKVLAVQRLELAQMGAGDVEVEVAYSGISTGTERLLWDGSMPPFPGLSYPLVPGYESVGTVVRRGADALLEIGETVFVPGSYSFKEAANVFGGSAERLVVAHSRAVRLPPGMGARGVLLALAATAYHAMSGGRADLPLGVPDLVVGHGVMGRLLARLTLALGFAPPTVWETQATRRAGSYGYPVIHPDDDDRKNYRGIYDVSGDAGLLNTLIARLQPGGGGEVVLAGFYKDELRFAYAPAFMREARIRIAAQWSPGDLAAVTALVQTGALDLDGLITHTESPENAQAAYATAFTDSDCLKMVLDWRT